MTINIYFKLIFGFILLNYIKFLNVVCVPAELTNETKLTEFRIHIFSVYLIMYLALVFEIVKARALIDYRRAGCETSGDPIVHYRGVSIGLFRWSIWSENVCRIEMSI